MAIVNDERYVFVVEWYDTAASLIRTYNLTYFASDGTIEMVTRDEPGTKGEVPEIMREASGAHH